VEWSAGQPWPIHGPIADHLPGEGCYKLKTSLAIAMPVHQQLDSIAPPDLRCAHVHRVAELTVSHSAKAASPLLGLLNFCWVKLYGKYS
jgi:hypothetical protein